MSIFTTGLYTDGPLNDSHSDYSAHLRVVQYCLDFSTCCTETVESIGVYILEQFVSIRVVPELIVGEGEAAVEIFSKASPPFCITVSRQC